MTSDNAVRSWLELAKNNLANSSPSSLVKIIIEPSSAVGGGKELLSKLLFMCLASVLWDTTRRFFICAR